MAFDVVVLGAAGVDTLVYLAAEPDLSRDSTMVSIVDTVGHAGAYTARGFARLGWRTAFVGALGQDWAGDAVRTALTADGVTLVAEVTDPRGTARSVNLVTPDGRRRAFYDGRGHADVPVPEIAGVFSDSRVALFHLSDWTRHLLAEARAARVLVAVDVQDVTDLDDPYRADYLAAADIVFMSAAHLADPEHAAAEVFSRGAELVVVGLGEAGALAVGRAGLIRAESPAVDLQIIDTNGAGDALAVGVLDSLMLGPALPTGSEHAWTRDEIRDALQAGQCAARWACTLVGGMGLITRAQLDDLRAQTRP